MVGESSGDDLRPGGDPPSDGGGALEEPEGIVDRRFDGSGTPSVSTRSIVAICTGEDVGECDTEALRRTRFADRLGLTTTLPGEATARRAATVPGTPFN
mmetsp:Transcript_30148/g.48634  ORF Transcript_30148/g.48634 Transcript_30148/m.48634 type:complete len:99 (+) Transcript_30148:1280-1576(+)